MTDITKDVQYYLQHHPAIQALVVDPYIGSDVAWTAGWIFDSNLMVRMENTQRCAIVVSYAGGWNAPLDGSTAKFPMVVVDIWADPTRALDNSVLEHDAKTKCFTIHDAVFEALHITRHADTNGGQVYFDTTRISSSELLAEPDLTWVEDGNGARMLRARYGVSLF